MFEISFAEMMVVAVVALIVIGPEKLPKVARTLGHLLGRAQRYVNGVKNDIARDMNMEELHHLQNQIKQEFDQTQATLNQTSVSVEEQVRQINQAVANTIETAVQPEAVTPQKIAPKIIAATALQVPDAPVIHVAPIAEASTAPSATPANKPTRQVAAPKRAVTAGTPSPPAVEASPTSAAPEQKTLTLD